MMDIPADTLEKLKCSSCEVYLSRGPVYLQHDGAGVCDRCYTPKCPATRNSQYEATAKLLKFPCKNQKLGCPEMVPFANEEEVIAHDEVCKHRQYVCPVLGSAHCDWQGSRAAILTHCRIQHPNHMLENPCTLTHDITNASLRTYIITAFQLLFVLHTKVCVATGKIFHSIRFLEKSEEVADFFFNLDIKRNNELISKEGQVVSQSSLPIQESTSVAVNTNSLLDVLGGFDDTTFTVTLKRRMSDTVEQPAKRIKLERDIVTCGKCKTEVTVFRYRDAGAWQCELCAPASRPCENKDCTYTDISSKQWKHKFYFCQQRIKCCICGTAVSRGSLTAHYVSKHKNISNRSGSKWRVKKTGVEGRRHLVSSVAGTVLCSYTLNDACFLLDVYMPVPNERLREFRCEVRLTNPTTRTTQTYTPDAEYNFSYDWRIVVKKQEFSSWSNEFHVIVVITKRD